jgi:soluble lytic murein transglycosylase-like protein
MAGEFGALEGKYGLPAGLLSSVAATESGGDPYAVSPKGAKGLFQFMDGTAKDMGLKGRGCL